MENLRFMISFLTLVLAASLASSCGSGRGQLQSITLAPATADAQAYPKRAGPIHRHGLLRRSVSYADTAVGYMEFLLPGHPHD